MSETIIDKAAEQAADKKERSASKNEQIVEKDKHAK